MPPFLKTKLRIFNPNNISNTNTSLRVRNLATNQSFAFQCQAEANNVIINDSARHSASFSQNVKINEKLWPRSGQEDVAITTKQMKRKYVGHTLRKDRKTRTAVKWNQGRKKNGERPRQSWKRSVTKKLDVQ